MRRRELGRADRTMDRKVDGSDFGLSGSNFVGQKSKGNRSIVVIHSDLPYLYRIHFPERHVYKNWQYIIYVL